MVVSPVVCAVPPKISVGSITRNSSGIARIASGARRIFFPMPGCRDCNAGSRAVGTAEGGPICSCGRDLACFCGAFHDLCGGAADLNGFVQTGLPVFIYAHSSTKTIDMISCPVTG